MFVNPGDKVHGANKGPTWVLSAPVRPHVGPMNLAIRESYVWYVLWNFTYICQDTTLNDMGKWSHESLAAHNVKPQPNKPQPNCVHILWNILYTVSLKKYAHGFVVLCFVVVMQSFIMNSHEVFIHIHQGCFAGTGAIVRLPQCQWSKSDGYGTISQCITTTKHSKAKTVCIFLGIYCMIFAYIFTVTLFYAR